MKVRLVDINEFDAGAGLGEKTSSPTPTTGSMKCEKYGGATLFNADCFDVLRELPDNCIDSAVIDGPYGIGFMNKEWDNFNPKAIEKGIRRKGGAGISPAMFSGKYDTSRSGVVRYQQFSYRWAVEVLRVLKAGGHLISFCSPQMYHRMTTGIEDAGFRIRDLIQWLFGSAHPLSYDISNAIDELAGAEREIVGPNPNRKGRRNWDNKPKNLTLPATDEAKKWDGWGTRLRHTNEPIVLARKPLAEKSVARNVLKHGTGGLNISATRIPSEEVFTNHYYSGYHCHRPPDKGKPRNTVYTNSDSRFPTNTIISEEVAVILCDKAKFYYSPKVSQKEKHACYKHIAKTDDKEGNTHPTVKPITLMEYLVKLVTPPGGVCIDIFAGSGSTGIACSNLGFDFIGVEKESEYFEIAKARIQYWQKVKTVA